MAAIVTVAAAGPLFFQVALRGKFPAGQVVLPWALLYCAWFSLWLVLQNYLLCVERARFTETPAAPATSQEGRQPIGSVATTCLAA